MRKQALWFGLVLIACLVASCGPAQPAAEPTAGAVVLELVGPGGSKSMTLDEIKALPAVTGWGGIKSSTGKITPPAEFKGVTMETLCGLVGGLNAGQGISVVASDGYAMTFSYEQAIQGNFILYDPGTGDEIQIAETPQVILAYERDGQPLPEKEDGTLRVLVVTSKNNQVADGHWSVKWVAKIEIKDMSQEWSLHLEGVLSEDMDRGTFESCASANCHGASWTDDKAQIWDGVPLWLLAGRVDDENKHSTGAFAQALADLGYTVDVVAADGYTVQLSSDRFARNDNIIVAYQVNENQLDDKHFPLRLVGVGLEKSEMVGQIVAITVNLATAPVEPTAPAGPAVLTITGAVESELAPTMADLQAMGVVTITAEHPKKGMQTYQGVRLNALLDEAGLQAEAAWLLFVAGDGFTASVPISAVQACADCLVALDDDGTLKTVMPGMDSNTWVKDVRRIEVGSAALSANPLALAGAVESERTLTGADLAALGVETLTLEHPKKGAQTYRGVRLTKVLDAAGVKAEAVTLAVISSDGYTVEMPLADVQACADCLLAVADDGLLSLAMPGMESSFWAKDVVTFEFK